MGLLLNLLTFPVSGPLRATTWIAEQVLAQAEQEYHDEGAIRRRIAEAQARLDAGELTEEEHDEVVDGLLERLMAAREHQAGLHDPGPDTQGDRSG